MLASRPSVTLAKHCLRPPAAAGQHLGHCMARCLAALGAGASRAELAATVASLPAARPAWARPGRGGRLALAPYDSQHHSVRSQQALPRLAAAVAASSASSKAIGPTDPWPAQSSDGAGVPAVWSEQLLLDPPPVGEVHVWYVFPDELEDGFSTAEREDYLRACCRVLSAAERDSIGLQHGSDGDASGGAAERSRITDPQAQRILSKALVRSTVARYCQGVLKPWELEFDIGVHGKPSLRCSASGLVGTTNYTNMSVECLMSRAAHGADPADHRAGPGQTPEQRTPICKLHFNLSHTQSLIAVAVSVGRRVGIDIESLARVTRHNPVKLARRWLSADEAGALQQGASKLERAQAFIRLWTMKEAYVKALGCGFSGKPFTSFSITEKTPASDSDVHVWGQHEVHIVPSEDGGRQWRFARLRPSPAHTGALCVEGSEDVRLAIRRAPLSLLAIRQ